MISAAFQYIVEQDDIKYLLNCVCKVCRRSNGHETYMNLTAEDKITYNNLCKFTIKQFLDPSSNMHLAYMIDYSRIKDITVVYLLKFPSGEMKIIRNLSQTMAEILEYNKTIG